jgi:NADH:ubiquinone oxidoreductase subunit 6 (subunit J)
MRDAFLMGGWGMVPTLLFGVLMIAASIRYAVRPERRLIPLQLSLGLITFFAGVLGCVTGVIKSLTALDALPADRHWIWIVGLGEALNCIALAFSLLIVAALAASVGAFRLARGTAAPEPEPA